MLNQNIVLETQIEKLNATVQSLSIELEKLKKPKRGVKLEEDFS